VKIAKSTSSVFHNRCSRTGCESGSEKKVILCVACFACSIVIIVVVVSFGFLLNCLNLNP